MTTRKRRDPYKRRGADPAPKPAAPAATPEAPHPAPAAYLYPVGDLQGMVEAFVDHWAPRDAMGLRGRSRFIDELRTLMNAYAREAVQYGSLPDRELHECNPAHVREQGRGPDGGPGPGPEEV